MRPKTPATTALLVNILMTVTIAAIAGITAYRAINLSVERSIKEDVSRDVAVMLERSPARGLIPDIAVVTKYVNTRIQDADDDRSDTVYLLATANGEKIIGNAAQLPEIKPDAWIELDGTDIGVAAGPMLIHRVLIEPDYSLIVGRRLTARESLNRSFVPVMAITILLLGAGSSLLIGFLNHRFRKRIHHINSVFRRIEQGDLTARVLGSPLGDPRDDISQLSANVDKALAEVERLLRGLETYSQVAAHELNHSISNLRARIAETGHTEIAADADRLIHLVTHILELAKIEATPGFGMAPINLEVVVNSVIKLYTEAFEDRSIRLEQDVCGETLDILGSRPLIESALVNLVSNALKHAPTDTTVTVRLRQDGHRISLSVRDQGPGVQDVRIDALATLGRRPDAAGNGFGLRHVEAVAIRHGAKLSLENTTPGLHAMLHFSAVSKT